ncbi:zinc finger protein 665-like [Folsomia candida]|uniref:Zinc finger protein 26 n=1 Tax=Folsomia candida TaxID=158441 RepID=A0A226DPZ4_FOLCA|nr:zinc finger protein 665-like [Folsomia candida]OXA47582.1 Zinc finger protein 26 [Folsomia candida]
MDLKPGYKWECPKCSKMFKTCHNLTRHMVTHDPDAKVKCEVCGIICKNKVVLSCHKWKLHSNRKRPSCNTCHRVFSSFTALRLHADTVHSTEARPRLRCTVPFCEKTYLNKGDLASHLRTGHGENSVRFRCTLCGKEFKMRGGLDRHILTHTMEKPHNCSTCGRSFAHSGSMKCHEKTHLEKSTRDRSKCHICPQTFLNRSGLHRHVRFVHENQRNYPCPFCDQRFSTSSRLKRHVEAKHATNKDPIYACDKCEYKSYSKHNLAIHRTRHNAARHGCYFCGKKFLTFSQLVDHGRVHTLEILKHL